MDAYGSELVERGQKCGVEIISLKAMEVSSPASFPEGFPWGHVGSHVLSSAI